MKFATVTRLPTLSEGITNQEAKAKGPKEEVIMVSRASTDNNHNGVIRDNKVTPQLLPNSIKSWATAIATKTSIALSQNSVN